MDVFVGPDVAEVHLEPVVTEVGPQCTWDLWDRQIQLAQTIVSIRWCPCVAGLKPRFGHHLGSLLAPQPERHHTIGIFDVKLHRDPGRLPFPVACGATADRGAGVLLSHGHVGGPAQDSSAGGQRSREGNPAGRQWRRDGP